jgi:hypothetical protein
VDDDAARTHRLPPEVAEPLAGVLKEDRFDLWANTRIRNLGNRTPYEALDDGDLDAVLELVRGYRDPSFT